MYLSQDPNDVGTVLQVNFGVAVFMGLGPLAQQAREWCAKVVKGFPGAFSAAEIVLGATIDQLEGYVLLNGRCRDVSLGPYMTGPVKHRPARVSRKQTVPFEKGRSDPGDTARRLVVREVPRQDSWVREVRSELPMLPPPSISVQKYLDGTYREGGCLRWRGKHDKKGYGYDYLEDEEKSELVHR